MEQNALLDIGVAVGPLIKFDATFLPVIIVPRDRCQAPEVCAQPITFVLVDQQTRLLGPGNDVSLILTVSRVVRMIEKPCATMSQMGHVQTSINKFLSKA